MDDPNAPLPGLITGTLSPTKLLWPLDLTTDQFGAKDLCHLEARSHLEQRKGRAIIVGRLVSVARNHGYLQTSRSGLAGHLHHLVKRGRDIALQRTDTHSVVPGGAGDVEELVVGERF